MSHAEGRRRMNNKNNENNEIAVFSPARMAGHHNAEIAPPTVDTSCRPPATVVEQPSNLDLSS
jgi:hypothetical protein